MRSTRFWRLLPGAALILLSAGPSVALTLGRAQGVAMLGRPLDVTVPVVVDAGVDPADLCSGVEVFYGESRVDGHSHELKSTGANTAVVRVHVVRPVDEAFVTVQVRVGCAQPLSRRFVLLSENPVEASEALAQPAPVAPVVQPEATTLPVAPAPAQRAAEKPTAAPRPRVVAAQRPTTTATRPVLPAPRSAPAQKPSTERPRLKLDAADLSSSASSLKPSTSLQAPAETGSPQRTEAAAQWQALNTSPEDLQRDAQRVVALEADMRAMRESVQKNQAMLAEMRSRLEQAERERYSNGLVYTLAGLLAAAGGLAALLWRRGRRSAQSPASWWADRSQPASAESSLEPQTERVAADAPVDLVPAAVVPALVPAALPKSEPAEAPAVVQEPAPVAPAPAMIEPAEPEAVDGLSALADLHSASAGMAADPGMPSGFMPSENAALPGAGSRVGMEVLSDLQQQVVFFTSLGEHERAIGLLREHIDAHPQGSAVAWLSLLDLYHRLQRSDDYEQLRRDYEWLFSDPQPSFADYVEDQAGLDAYPTVLARIQALWNDPAVLGVIEEAVLRQPGAEGASSLTLAALRELLMLYSVAAELVSGEAQASTELADLSALPVAASGGTLDLGAFHIDPLPNEEWKKLADPSSRPAGLDLNLDDLPPAGPSAPVGARAGGSDNLLDFDLDLSEEFKLPKR